MARTKTSTRDDTKTLTTSWRNKHLENIYFCVYINFKLCVSREAQISQLWKKCVANLLCAIIVTIIILTFFRVWGGTPLCTHSNLAWECVVKWGIRLTLGLWLSTHSLRLIDRTSRELMTTTNKNPVLVGHTSCFCV